MHQLRELHVLFFTVICVIHSVHASFGPPYPVTGAWFMERYTTTDWNHTLHAFSRQGGDTILVRAPALQIRTRDEIQADEDFKWCTVYDVNGNATFCVDQAVSELTNYGMKVAHLATYKQERSWNTLTFMKCRNYEKQVFNGRVYSRMVIPLNSTEITSFCNYRGLEVMVIFTVFSGIDSSELLVPLARDYNMSVYLGLPIPAGKMYECEHLLDAYHVFVGRIIESYEEQLGENKTQADDVLLGYLWSDDFLLSDVHNNTSLSSMLKEASAYAHHYNKSFGVSTWATTNKLLSHADVNSYQKALTTLAATCNIDIVSIADGLGSGFMAPYWDIQKNETIKNSDNVLFEVLQHLVDIRENVTYADIFMASSNEMFEAFGGSADVIRNTKSGFQFWLNIEAFDVIYDDPCLPIDHAGSGLSRMLNRVTKSRVDRVLTHTGTTIQKAISTAWDPSFTCTTRNHNYTLTNQIVADINRPIIAQCGFHSRANRSVVVIGYNLEGETQGFTMEWPKVGGQRQTSNVYGYYFELDWGIQHDRIPSLMYIQMYDPYNVIDLAPKGHVRIIANNSYHACAFTYDFTSGDNNYPMTTQENRKLYKKFTREWKVGGYRERIEAQDTPFAP